MVNEISRVVFYKVKSHITAFNGSFLMESYTGLPITVVRHNLERCKCFEEILDK